MKTNSINYKLNTALVRRSSEAGFAMPVVFGLGLFMMLVAATMIVRSQGDNVTASAQKSTNQALSAAETGITRYKAFLDLYRNASTYPDCVNRNSTTGACSDSGSIKSWYNANSLPANTSCTATSTTNITNNASTSWQNIGSDASQGQYRLVSYAYSGSVKGPGTGTLTVESRTNLRDPSGTPSDDTNTSKVRLVVNIPVAAGNINFIPVPGLWLGTGTTGGNTIQGDVIVSDCNTDTSGITNPGYSKLKANLKFPLLPTKPTFVSSPNNHVLGDITSSLTLPRSGDTATNKIINGSSVQVYEYSVGNITANNVTVTITPGQRVTFYLDGDIDPGGSGDIIHACGSASGCKPTNFQIFGYKSSGGKICTHGSNKVEAFIFAPNYYAGAGGAGGGAGGFKGTVWVNNWNNGPNCGSNTSNTVLVETAKWDELGLAPENLPPSINTETAWKRQEM